MLKTDVDKILLRSDEWLAYQRGMNWSDFGSDREP